MAETVISTHNLTKYYKHVHAVDGIDICVKKGEIYGFLGRNGAGKTTTIRMLLGLIRPTSGYVMVRNERMDMSKQQILSKIGSLIESASAYPNLTVQENLELQSRMIRAPKSSTTEVIKLLHLEEYAGRQVGKLSLGNKQRLSLARALLNDPEILVLDEPANALDPAGILEIRDLLRNLAEQKGVTIFMSSHILVEVAHIADRIGIVHEGRLIEELSVEEMHQKASRFIEIEVSNPTEALKTLSKELNIKQAEVIKERQLHLYEGFERVSEIARSLVNNGFELTRLNVTNEDLESYFIRLTGDER